MIKVNNIEKTFGVGEGAVKVLKGVTMQIDDGDFAVLLGASGSGKSTLLNIMSGLESPDCGSVLYDDIDITGFSDDELTRFRKDNVGFVFQQYYLLPNLNVKKNVKLGAELVGNNDYIDIIESVGLGEMLDKKPSQLSGGEQQRVAIARALAKKPKVLFMDEPTGALDEETGRAVMDYLIKLQEKLQFTMIMVTHNSNIAETANTVYTLSSGKMAVVTKNERKKTAYEIAW